MYYIKKGFQLVDNYIIARWQKRPSTALFWYLPEFANIQTPEDLTTYKQSANSPFYLMNYRKKLTYPLTNSEGIIVLPYGNSIGTQVNPEAAFQYALGVHDQFYLSHDTIYLDLFWTYVTYFFNRQTDQGLWAYTFDWYSSKAPWYSALAQARGASVFLRAWLLSKDIKYLTAAKYALHKFNESTSAGGFLHHFHKANVYYFEEYPTMPTGVINGFMASLICIWELKYWSNDSWFDALWQLGIASLHHMLPYYTNGWWSLYDLDQSSLINVNSPRYHLLEIHYLQILSLLTESPQLAMEYKKRKLQYGNKLAKCRALGIKAARKIIYR